MGRTAASSVISADAIPSPNSASIERQPGGHDRPERDEQHERGDAEPDRLGGDRALLGRLDDLPAELHVRRPRPAPAGARRSRRARRRAASSAAAGRRPRRRPGETSGGPAGARPGSEPASRRNASARAPSSVRHTTSTVSRRALRSRRPRPWTPSRACCSRPTTRRRTWRHEREGARPAAATQAADWSRRESTAGMASWPRPRLRERRRRDSRAARSACSAGAEALTGRATVRDTGRRSRGAAAAKPVHSRGRGGAVRPPPRRCRRPTCCGPRSRAS